ncbi:MAG: S8 family serine peptidase [Muribaculaceae bacterium]|nr:S8 family serine peptidase [Muribaculaceae bacterium]
MKRLILLLILSIPIFPLFSAKAEGESLFIPQIVKIEKESEIDSLMLEGVDIIRRRGDILLCLFPNRATRGGDAITRQRSIVPALDKAKSFYDAGSIQSGASTGTPYTGKGVVVGICDIGIDPLHPTFLDSEERSRIRRVVQYVEHEGIRLELEGEEAYREWQTDDPDMYHATHVCGILAGGGAGTPYSGIASDAEIVVTVSTLTEVGLLAGVEDVIDYAQEAGKPAVINISVGSYTGAHDGSSLFSQYLDMCADDAIIVLSAGNEGSHKNTLISGFSDELRTLSFRLGNRSWDEYEMYGSTEIWSGSGVPLQVSLGLYDTNEKRVIRWLEPFRLTGGDSLKFSWNGSDYSEGFPFKGELTALGYVDFENGRHCTSLGYEFIAEEQSSAGSWARYELAVGVSGSPGDDVEVYADGIYTRLSAGASSPLPSSERSVSDLACGFNVISVGMYGNRDSVPRNHPEVLLDDEVYWESTGYEAGAPVVHSSFGTLRDGRVTPLTTAPGADLMSAFSRPFLESYPFHPHQRLGDTVWVDEGGTSMAAPYVAGYIATWLEAVPTLTSADVISIIMQSNRHGITDPEDPHIGAGYFDPVAGLRLALLTGGVGSVDTPVGVLPPDEYIEVYDAAGMKRYAGLASGLSGVGNGLYVVKTTRGVYKKIICP